MSKSNILAAIVAEKQRELERLPAASVSAQQLRAALQARGDLRDFIAALRKSSSSSLSSSLSSSSSSSFSSSCSLIAEVKKASPSAGVICPDFDPVRIARAYEAAGASCLSVLTDQKFFQGSLEYLRQIRQAVKLPLLRKDFIIDPRQLLEAVQWGADAILLIVAILDGASLRQLYSLATQAGLAVLVEVHDASELDRALDLGAELIGVNNRDLTTFNVDLATTERLASRLHSSALAGRTRPLLVAESGIHTRADVERLAAAGAHAILVGESLMKDGNIRSKVQELLGK
jgi:indole-3-glycerol phosphate synthase